MPHILLRPGEVEALGVSRAALTATHSINLLSRG